MGQFLRWPLLCLLSVMALRPSAGMELKDELDSLLCPAMKEMKGKIIDVHKSLDLGAQLIDGSWTPTLDQCASECCHKLGCDLALYKNDGVSQSGKNCYYIKCVSLDNCVMVDHGGFTSVVLETIKGGSVPDVSLKGDGSDSGDSDRTGHAPPSPADSAPTTQAPLTKATPTQPAVKDSSNGNGVQPTNPSKSDSDTKQNPAPESIGSVHSSTASPPTKPPSHSTEKVVELLDSKSALGQDKGQSDGGNVDCRKHGCDGSGVIAIAVVASICFVIIVLVVTVLLRKVITDNRRRRFKNVDYLINGMYT